MSGKNPSAPGLAILLCFAAILALGCPRGLSPLRGAPTRRRSEPVISVFFHENGTTRKMPLEQYLVGVVAGEMKPDWPRKAYAAQAIVARTFTMEFIGRGGTRRLHGTDICTDEEHAQAYTTSSITPLIRQAVADTRGVVMLHGGRYVHGWFSASCGGRTAYARQGLAYKGAEPPYISSVSCPEGRVIPKSEQLWQARFSGAEMAAAVKKATGRDLGQVTGAERLGVDRTTHRTTRLRLTGANGSAELAAADFRVAIGPEKMRSIWLLELKSEGGATAMSGRGFGHGVGLCQWGAHALAKEGKTPNEIVQHFYPRVKITKMW
ncbi:MAG: SpoIID/LytB domain-containing protein [Patescibacteria group bacterium]